MPTSIDQFKPDIIHCHFGPTAVLLNRLIKKEKSMHLWFALFMATTFLPYR